MIRHLYLTAALLVLALAGAAAAEKWHHPLYLGGDGLWRQRVPITIHNEMDRPAKGETVSIPVGQGDGEADLVGVPAQQIRVCDANGVEMLFALVAPSGKQLTTGPIPAGSTLVIPAECPANATATYYAYFDNPSAWEVPDHLQATGDLRNGSVEEGEGDTPHGWRHDEGDAWHRASWVTENPRSGKRCLKTVVAAGAEPSWIATRQSGLSIIGGAKYTMRAWVKAQDVQGYAGWYIHVGNAENPMLISPMLSAGDGTYDWKEVTIEFTAPPEADRADLGTVLRGTGTAWFDDVSLECATVSRLSARAGKPETIPLRETGSQAAWYDDNPNDSRAWDYRVPVRVVNLSDQQQSDALVYIDLAPLYARLRGRANRASLRVTDGTRVLPHYQLGEGVLFAGSAPARTAHTYYLYLSTDRRVKPGRSLGYASLLASTHNRVRNASFERGTHQPADWPGSTEGQSPAGATLRLDAAGRFGKQAAYLSIPHDSKPAWTGWRQNVPVEPGKTYLFSAWVKTRDIRNGSVQLHCHYRNADGELCEAKQMDGAGPALTGTNDWTLLAGMFEMPEDIAHFQLHLTMSATGTVWHDGVVLTEVTRGVAGSLEARAPRQSEDLVVWPVNAVVKVFQDDVPPRQVGPARITAARNEKEPLQLAIRSAAALSRVRVQVEPPANRQGQSLPAPTVNVVGYVPIDHPTSYYSTKTPAWHRKYPTAPGSCDGWAGLWPDPLLPRDTFDLAANATQPVWLTVSVPKDAAPGDYTGTVRLLHGSQVIREIPYTVHVWNFTLPDESHVKAIYDCRQWGGVWQVEGLSPEESRRRFWRFMAERRVCPDTIHPAPILSYRDGQVTADFTAFDQAAEYYFNELKLPHAYTPGYFYLFGWGLPPAEKFGQQPYEGTYPFEGADRSKLRPEFKQAYQACLKVYWDHLKEKGWDKKVVLYISDEPFADRPEIVAQMKALCAMIREVDPEIPIYCSTWNHVPAWDGSLTVWGLGHYGLVAPEKLKQIREGGARLWWTTDGQMCTDTPYCAVERLLPHYCFKYGAEAYEFWGIDWLTYDPYRWGWHSYIHQTDAPGNSYWVRYPNGDGFLAYPGGPIGHDGPVSSVRLEQAREGVEDYEYLYLLQNLAAKATGSEARVARQALAKASTLVTIPNAGGRYSTKILPNPDAVFQTKEALARAIERLSR